MSHFASEIIPSGTGLPFFGATAPTGWLLCDGSAVSRAVYAKLFAVLGTTYGAGDGSTTFNLPDIRGRSLAGKDNMGGVSANRITPGGSGVAGTTLGSAGGTETVTLSTANLPSHTHGINHDHAAFNSAGASTNTTGINSVGHTHTFSTGGMNVNAVHNHTTTGGVGADTVATFVGGSTFTNLPAGALYGFRYGNPGQPGMLTNTANIDHVHSGTTAGISANHTHEHAHTHSVDVPAFTGTSGSTGSGTALNTLQPTMIANYIIKI